MTTSCCFHDAVRPLVSARIVSECFEALETYDAVDVAIPSADTIIEVDERNVIAAIPPRANLRRGQTPQAFRRQRSAARVRRCRDRTPTSRHRRLLGRAALHPGSADLGGVRRRTQHEGHRPDRRLPRRQALPAHVRRGLPATLGEEAYTEALDRQDDGRLRRQLRHRRGHRRRSPAATAPTCSRFSRSSTNTQVERREDIRAAVARRAGGPGRVDYVVNTAGVLPAGARRDQRGDRLGGHRDQLPRAGGDRPGVLPAPRRPPAAACCYFTSSSYTRGRSGYSLYSSAKAAVVNLTQALADEWSGDGVRSTASTPSAPAPRCAPRRSATSRRVRCWSRPRSPAASLDVLISGETGLIVDVRRDDPLAP